MQYFRAMRSELTVEYYFVQSHIGFQTTQYLKNYRFLRHMVQSKQCSFSTSLSSALFDDLILKQMNKKEFEISMHSMDTGFKFFFQFKSRIFEKVLKL